MLARRLTLVVVSLTISLGLTASVAGAAPGGCTGGKVSAIDQYCETIPAAVGSQPARPGAPTLATTLPHKVVSQLARSGRLRALLSLPAQSPHRRRGEHGHRTRPESSSTVTQLRGPRSTVAGVSAGPVLIGPIAVLIAIAAIMIGIASVRRWRRG